jgi:hypothetical protein
MLNQMKEITIGMVRAEDSSAVLCDEIKRAWDRVYAENRMSDATRAVLNAPAAHFEFGVL